MCLQEGNAALFFNCFPKLIELFISLGNTNYTNACELMYLQWKYWNSEPDNLVLEYFNNYFEAFNEEKGETSIHIVKTHIRDFNFSLANISKCYKESSAAQVCFEELEIARSHKISKPKTIRLERAHWCTRTILVENRLCLIEEMISDEVYLPFSLKIISFRTSARRAHAIAHFTRLRNRFINRTELAQQHVAHLQEKLLKPLAEAAIASIEYKNLFW